jgi:DNA-binding transcriptional ArsR family regulator
MATVDGPDDIQVSGDAVEGEPAMPELPPQLVLSTDQQFKAIADPLRSKILGIIQTRPATAKQIADRLGEAPGNTGHHLQVLEKAGLAQVVATRVVRGIIAKYYTRTARIFSFRFPPEVTGETPMIIDILEHARQELFEAIAAYGDKPCQGAFPHVRISAERAQVYQERLEGLLADLLHEPVDPHGQVYGLVYQMFLAPPYLQDAPASPSPQGDDGDAKAT